MLMHRLPKESIRNVFNCNFTWRAALVTILIAETEYLKIGNIREDMFIWAHGLRGYSPPREWRQGRVCDNRKEEATPKPDSQILRHITGLYHPVVHFS